MPAGVDLTRLGVELVGFVQEVTDFDEDSCKPWYVLDRVRADERGLLVTEMIGPCKTLDRAWKIVMEMDDKEGVRLRRVGYMTRGQMYGHYGFRVPEWL